MPVPSAQVATILSKLAARGSAAARRAAAQQGANERQFGVKVADLRALARKLRTDHDLALGLWATGNADAMLLATLIFDPARLTAAEIDAMMRPLTYTKLVDEYSFHVVASHPAADALRRRWMASPQPCVGRAGWNLQIAQVLGEDPAAPPAYTDRLLRRIEKDLAAAPTQKQESMNRCLCEIGIRFPALTDRAVAIGERIGRIDDRPVPKGSVSTYAPEWIAAGVKQFRT